MKQKIIKVSEEDANGCWIWQQSSDKDGYGKIVVDGVLKRAHRLSYETFVGEIPDGLYVLHRCDVRNCVNPQHLFLGTHQDNMDDMNSKGRNGRYRLTEDQITHIEYLVNNTIQTHKTIGLWCGVSTSTVSKISRGVYRKT